MGTRARLIFRLLLALGVLAASTVASVATVAAENHDAETDADNTDADDKVVINRAALYTRSVPSEAAREDVPSLMLSVYRYAASDAECDLPWALLAGIADVASDHGRANRSKTRPNGSVYPALFGPELDGQGGRHYIPDTDGGRLDGDVIWDRAMGPFQFIPTTWEAYSLDGNGDRIRDPQNIWDAAASAAAHLCAYDADDPASIDGAIEAYYQHPWFIDEVLEAATRYTGTPLPPARLNQLDAITVLRTTDNGEVERFDPSLNLAERIGVNGDGIAYGDWDGDGEANLARLSFADGSGLVSFDPEAQPPLVAGATAPVSGDRSDSTTTDSTTADASTTNASATAGSTTTGSTSTGSTSTTSTTTAGTPDGEAAPDVPDEVEAVTGFVGAAAPDAKNPGETTKVPVDDASAPTDADALPTELRIVEATITELVVNFVADPNAELIAGDWNGDYDDELGLFTTFDGVGRFTRVDDAGDAQPPVSFGQTGDQPVAGDWDGDAVSEFGVYRPAADGRPGLFLRADRDGNAVGAPIRIGEPGAIATVGDWDGDGRDSLALAQPAPATGESAIQRFDESGDAFGDVLVVAGAQSIPIAGIFAPPEPEPTDAPAIPAPAEDLTFFGTRRGPNGEDLDLWRVRGIIVETSIAGNLENMLRAAAADGFVISGWGWRSNEQQIALREQNCADIYISSPSTCRPPTAIPGTSRHEYGRAIDFNVDGSVLTANSPEFRWMLDNAGTYGFINLPSEPWHWSDTGG